MPYVLIEKGEVAQKQPYPQDGFIEAPHDVVCGYLYDGTSFTAPPPEPPGIPQVVKMAQARKALIKSGTTIASVDTAIGNMAEPVERELAQTDWEYSDTVSRDSDLVTTLGAELGLTSQEIDDLFVLAATL